MLSQWTPTPPVFPIPPSWPDFRALFCLAMPNAKSNSANSSKAPTAAKPAITPPLRDDLPELCSLEDELPVSSMTLCRTHSPNVQPLKVSPDNPKTDSSTLCLKAHFAVLVLLSGASQETSKFPPKPFIVAVRLIEGTPPQNAVPGLHVQVRF
jgi:hypothetical protein